MLSRSTLEIRSFCVVRSGEAKKDQGSCEVGLAISEAWGDWRMEALDDEPGVFWVMFLPYVHSFHYLIISVTYEICATILSAKNFKISKWPNGAYTNCRSPDPLEFASVQGTRRLRQLRLLLRLFVLDVPATPGERIRGIRAVEYVTAHRRCFGEEVGSGVVFCFER